MDSVPRNVPTRRALPTCDAHHGQPAVVQLLVLGIPELVPDALLILKAQGEVSPVLSHAH